MLDLFTMILSPKEIEFLIFSTFRDVRMKTAYAEATYFYNRDDLLPNGVYFLTLKENDGPNDKASNLGRERIYRLSFKPNDETYQTFFGKKPSRPKKGEAISSGYELDKIGEWQPHAIYAWMGWTMILSPTKEQLEALMPSIEKSYLQAKAKFEDRVRVK